MKLIDLLEARRNTSQNPKFSQLEQLKQIAQKHGTKNIYCRFVNVPMLKNTILTTFDTPLGMCSYPLQYVIDNEMDVPFAGGALYILVFKPNSNNIWKLDGSMWQQMIPRMLKAISKVLKIDVDQNKQFNSDRELWYYMYDCIWSTGQNKPALLARQILTSMGLTGVDDLNNKGIIHQNEPTQAIFFNASDLQLLSVINNLSAQTIFREYDKFVSDGALVSYTILWYMITRLGYNLPRNILLPITARVGNKVLISRDKEYVSEAITYYEAKILSKYGFNFSDYIQIITNGDNSQLKNLIELDDDNIYYMVTRVAIYKNHKPTKHILEQKRYLNIIDPNILKKENLA